MVETVGWWFGPNHWEPCLALFRLAKSFIDLFYSPVIDIGDLKRHIVRVHI